MTSILIKEKVLEENRRVHALENKLYLPRHPEQTNFFQEGIVETTLDQICSQLNSNAKILDLGCGTGYLLLRFLRRGFHVTGVDLSSEMVQVLKNSISENEKERARLEVGDVESYIEENIKKFDLVVFSAVMHHLFDYELVLKEACQRVNSGTKILIFFEPLKQKVNPSIRYGLHRCLSWLDEKFYQVEMGIRNIPLLEDEYHHSDYQRQFGGIDPDKIEKIFLNEKCSIEKVEKYCARRSGVNAWLANRILKTQNTFNILAEKI
ncbi:MAG: class I SAM-dependent methyltransferase [Nitrospinae bacterium]|nr:class I SAM-dependent methyltransferase [Nitrospinota bacterium]